MLPNAVSGETIAMVGSVAVALITGVTSVVLAILTRPRHRETDEVALPTPEGPRVVDLGGETPATREAIVTLALTLSSVQDAYRQVKADFDALGQEIAPLVDWVDAGYPPPAPAISDRLRHFLAGHISK